MRRPPKRIQRQLTVGYLQGIAVSDEAEKVAAKEAQKSSPACSSGRPCCSSPCPCRVAHRKQRTRTMPKDAPSLDFRRTHYQWPSVTSDTGPAAALNLPIASPESSQEVTPNHLDITPHWQDLMPYDPTSGEVFSSLPEAWRKDRKRAAALGYNSTGQPRTQRNALQRNPQKRHSVPPKPSEEVRPNTADDPTMHHEPVQSSWVAKSTGLQSCYPPSQGMILAEAAWWHGEEPFFTASGTALPVQGAQHHFFHQF
ncbi:MAG: hypothetical protein Q9223_000125 [Gallowayella weberi]